MWLLFSILIFVSPFIHCHGQVDISPSGMQYIPINTLRNITCHIEGGAVSAWAIILNNHTEQRIDLLLNNVPDVPGITAGHVNGGFSTLLITVNTSDTSVIGLRCEGSVRRGSSSTPVSNTVNLTIYGIADPPTELSVSTNNNSLTASWTYRIIPTVTVMFNISVTFLSPSQLENITVCVTDTDSYTFTLEGVRSCDPFTMCITATNTVGQSNSSCVNNSLPYIPSADDIRYSLFREGDSYSLNMTVQMAQCPENDSLLYVALLQTQNSYQHLTSPAIPASTESATVIRGLFRKTLYTLTIIANNSLGIGFSEPQQFCTNDVQGVTICPTMMDGVFNISCDYVSGCNYSGCSYELSSTNSYINGSIIGMNYRAVKVDVNTLYNLTVKGRDEEVTIIELVNVNSSPSCFTTAAVTSDTTRITEVNNNNGTIAVAVTVSILIVVFIVILLAILLVVCLLRNDYCRSHSLLLFQKFSLKKGSDLVVKHQGNGNPNIDFKTEDHNQVDSIKINMQDAMENDVMYNSLTTVKNKKTNDQLIEENYSQIGTDPIYHVLEKDKSSTLPKETNGAIFSAERSCIPIDDDDVPPTPPYNSDGGDSSVQQIPLPSQRTTGVNRFKVGDSDHLGPQHNPENMYAEPVATSAV